MKTLGVMSGIIGANNEFGLYFNNPDADMQGNITLCVDLSQFLYNWASNSWVLI